MTQSLLERFTHSFAKWTGTGSALLTAACIILLWIGCGFEVGFSPIWQSSLNIFISLLTFLMVFIMQRADRKGLQAIQLKLNELIAAEKTASNDLINLENATEKEIQAVQDEHQKIV